MSMLSCRECWEVGAGMRAVCSGTHSYGQRKVCCSAPTAQHEFEGEEGYPPLKGPRKCGSTKRTSGEWSIGIWSGTWCTVSGKQALCVFAIDIKDGWRYWIIAVHFIKWFRQVEYVLVADKLYQTVHSLKELKVCTYTNTACRKFLQFAHWLCCCLSGLSHHPCDYLWATSQPIIKRADKCVCHSVHLPVCGQMDNQTGAIEWSTNSWTTACALVWECTATARVVDPHPHSFGTDHHLWWWTDIQAGSN